LLVAGIVSLILGATVDKHPEIGWIEGFAILIAVAIVVLVTAINDYEKQKKFGALQEANNEGKKCEVIRDGKVNSIHPERLVVGDIMLITAGLHISADAIVLSAPDTIMMSEASITGENDSIKKSPFEDCV
jgi:P-type E1-E2 ATPase